MKAKHCEEELQEMDRFIMQDRSLRKDGNSGVLLHCSEGPD